MTQQHSIFTEEEKTTIIQAATNENGDFNFTIFLDLVTKAKAKKGYPDG